jgi:hypothetical protein
VVVELVMKMEQLLVDPVDLAVEVVQLLLEEQLLVDQEILPL